LLHQARQFDALESATSWPSDIKLVGSRLVVLGGEKHEPQLTVIDTSSGAVIARVLQPASDETVRYSPLARTADGKGLWLYELHSHRVARATLSDTGDRLILSDTTTLRERGALRSPTLVNGHFLAAGYFNQGLLAQFDTAGNAVRVVGMPPVADTSVVADMRHHLNFGSLATEPGGSHVAIVYQSTPRLDVLDADGRPVARLSREGRDSFPIPTPVKDGHGNVRFGLKPGMPVGFLAVDATRQHIYALYSGARFKPGSVDFLLGTAVLRVRWDGVVDQEYTLPFPAHTITVDPGERGLYASGQPGEPIRVYRLPAPSSPDNILRAKESVATMDR
jgi:hypothetical protein